MRARAVIGANFGDEGKGLITDYLCATEGAGVVVRFNGGAQAGHTVVTPRGTRHVFGHFGSGTFVGVPTFLSEFFICNPILYFRELDNLRATGAGDPVVYAHPSCLVTTHADMIINQRLERERGHDRHGSCGVGVNETIVRSQIAELTITMGDLWNHSSRVEKVIAQICDKYAKFRTGEKIDTADMTEHFLAACWAMANHVGPLGIGQCQDPVFEGAQGLLLDQDNKAYYPHVTRSNTGIKNVRKLCAMANIDHIDPYYVSRTYVTRHGAGHLPSEDDRMSYPDDTNLEHPWQGKIRFAPLNLVELSHRCRRDADDLTVKLALTHCDQEEVPVTVLAPHQIALLSYGPTRDDVRLYSTTPTRALSKETINHGT